MTPIDPSDIVGQGAIAPRARFATDARSLVLDGEWAFRYTPVTAGADAPDDLRDPALDTSGWDRLPVPSSWPMHGYGAPAYTNTRFPFPIDPPHVPDENPVGDHATSFAWTPGDATVLRLDGVDAAGEVLLNGLPISTTRGSRLTHEFDVTDAIRDGDNLLVVRVHQWSATSYLEDQDMWWLPGVFRSVTVLDRPRDGIRDLRVSADWIDGSARLRVEVETDGGEAGGVATVRIPELGIATTAGEDVTVAGAEPWSAESPRLYDLEVATPGETARLRVGFRTVSIVDGALLVNGAPILMRGVNRHEHHPDLGRVVPRETVERELRLMKQHNVNAIRTSHYPPHPDLPALADELGFWLILECDLETHGFVHVGWRGNPSDDPQWLPAYLDRIARTIERDRNHPSVIVWSLGNESGTGRNLEAMAAEARRRDPSRPIHYEGEWSSTYVDLYSRMYPSHAETELIARREEPPLDDPEADAHRRGLPFVLCEYAHAMGTGPGGMTEYQDLIESSPRMAGAFVWEWLEHGIRRRTDDGREWFAYGGDFGEKVHDGNFVADGLVDADRVPRPQLADFARVIAPVRMHVDGRALRIRNRYDTVDTGHLRFVWTLEARDGAVREGELDVAPIGPRGEGVAELPEVPADALLTVRAVLAEDAAWAPAGHEVAWMQEGSLVSPAPPAPTPLHRDADRIGVGPVVLDARTGRLVSIAGTTIDGPRLTLWRAPTDNDLRADWGAKPELADADDWTRSGLDDLRSRLVRVDVVDERVVVETRVAPPSYDWGVRVVSTWSGEADRAALAVVIEPEGEWPGTWARAGLVLELPFAPETVRWTGRGPGPSYPDTGQAARLGRWSATLDELRTDYVRPQESGARAGVVDLELRPGASGGGFAVEPGGAAVTLSRWTAHELARAAHPVDLPPSQDRTVVTLDLAQHGVGTAACGPGVLPEYRLTPRRLEGRIVFRR